MLIWMPLLGLSEDVQVWSVCLTEVEADDAVLTRERVEHPVAIQRLS